MVLGCGNNFVKYFLFVVNFFVCIFGGIIAGISLWATLDKNFTETLRTLIEKLKIPNVELSELSKVLTVFIRRINMNHSVCSIKVRYGCWLLSVCYCACLDLSDVVARHAKVQHYLD